MKEDGFGRLSYIIMGCRIMVVIALVMAHPSVTSNEVETTGLVMVRRIGAFLRLS